MIDYGRQGSPCSDILQRLHKLVYADARLAENALERANNQSAMHGRRNAPISSGHANMRTCLPCDGETHAFQSSDGFGSRNVPRQFHA